MKNSLRGEERGRKCLREGRGRKLLRLREREDPDVGEGRTVGTCWSRRVGEKDLMVEGRKEGDNYIRSNEIQVFRRKLLPLPPSTPPSVDHLFTVKETLHEKPRFFFSSLLTALCCTHASGCSRSGSPTQEQPCVCPANWLAG